MGNNKCPRCQHYNCNNMGVVAVPIPRRGGGHAFLCEYHAQGNLERYSRENQKRIGAPKKNGLTYSFELETMRPTIQAYCELGLASFMSSYDCTCDCEFKSPIYNGANGLKAILPSVELLKNNNNIVIDNNCGTHLHIGRIDYDKEKQYALIPFYWTIQGRLWREMDNLEEKATKIFGRKEGKWAFGAEDSYSWYYRAQHIGAGGYATRDPLEAHPAYLNIQHDYSLEWRRAFFRTAEQYSDCIDLCRALSNPIFDFCNEIVTAKESNRYNEAEFMTKAKKLGNKLAKIFREW